jgi:hypothetical protein
MGPIEACQHFDVFDDELIQRMRTYYESIGTYRSSVMNKADPGKALRWVEPIIRKHHPYIDKFLGGNFYRHKDPYHPHVDHELHWPLAVNFVIPIYQEGPPVDFIVFDQRWHMSPATWSMVQKLNKFFGNGFTTTEPLEGIPGNSEIEGHTHAPIDEKFWRDHLHHMREYYYGLSGKAFPFTPKSLIMFETKHIHCTGRFHNGNKLGLTLRYSVKQEEA